MTPEQAAEIVKTVGSIDSGQGIIIFLLVAILLFK